MLTISETLSYLYLLWWLPIGVLQLGLFSCVSVFRIICITTKSASMYILILIPRQDNSRILWCLLHKSGYPQIIIIATRVFVRLSWKQWYKWCLEDCLQNIKNLEIASIWWMWLIYNDIYADIYTFFFMGHNLNLHMLCSWRSKVKIVLEIRWWCGAII